MQIHYFHQRKADGQFGTISLSRLRNGDVRLTMLYWGKNFGRNSMRIRQSLQAIGRYLSANTIYKIQNHQYCLVFNYNRC
jgi:hypothetical protein